MPNSPEPAGTQWETLLAPPVCTALCFVLFFSPLCRTQQKNLGMLVVIHLSQRPVAKIFTCDMSSVTSCHTLHHEQQELEVFLKQIRCTKLIESTGWSAQGINTHLHVYIYEYIYTCVYMYISTLDAEGSSWELMICRYLNGIIFNGLTCLWQTHRKASIGCSCLKPKAYCRSMQSSIKNSF